ncbi:MAG: SdrD B-like domain-containing protein, partial [Caldilinea sp.]
MNISQYFAHAQTQIGRIMLAAIVTTALILAVTAPAQAVISPPTGQIGNDEVNFIAVEYDTPTPGQSTWYYEIKSGDRPAISHVNLKLGNCVHILDAGTWDGDDTGRRTSGGGQPEPGGFPAAPKTDPSTGITGLKFDQGFEDGETRYYYFTVNGNYPSADAIVATKGGDGFDTGLVTGVSQVACDAGSLSVTKEVAWAEVTSDASQTFQICISGSSFPIGSEEGACKSIGADGGTLTWENLIAGDYIVIEIDPGDNWIVSGSGVSVTVSEGNLAEHTVTNTAKEPLPGAISACKFNDLNGNGVQDEDEPSISDWQMDIYEGVPAEDDEPIVSALTEGEGGFVTFENLLPGEYTVCEGEVDGWLPTTGLCQTIIVGSEQVTSVTFGNVRGARILVDKITDPAEAADVFDFELLKGETAISFSLAGGGDAFDSGLLFPGVYSIAELETEGWALDDITCVNIHEENAASDLSNPATIALQASQVVVCPFTNTKKMPVTPEPTPVTPEPTPVTPEPTPVTPEPTPVTPEPTPVTPEPTPVTPEPTPVTPESTPVTPEPTPVPAG